MKYSLAIFLSTASALTVNMPVENLTGDAMDNDDLVDVEGGGTITGNGGYDTYEVAGDTGTNGASTIADIGVDGGDKLYFSSDDCRGYVDASCLDKLGDAPYTVEVNGEDNMAKVCGG